MDEGIFLQRAVLLCVKVVAMAARHFYTANEERGRWEMGAQDEAEDGHINLLCSFETTPRNQHLCLS